MSWPIDECFPPEIVDLPADQRNAAMKEFERRATEAIMWTICDPEIMRERNK